MNDGYTKITVDSDKLNKLVEHAKKMTQDEFEEKYLSFEDKINKTLKTDKFDAEKNMSNLSQLYGDDLKVEANTLAQKMANLKMIPNSKIEEQAAEISKWPYDVAQMFKNSLGKKDKEVDFYVLNKSDAVALAKDMARFGMISSDKITDQANQIYKWTPAQITTLKNKLDKKEKEQREKERENIEISRHTRDFRSGTILKNYKDNFSKENILKQKFIEVILRKMISKNLIKEGYVEEQREILKNMSLDKVKSFNIFLNKDNNSAIKVTDALIQYKATDPLSSLREAKKLLESYDKTLASIKIDILKTKKEISTKEKEYSKSNDLDGNLIYSLHFLFERESKLERELLVVQKVYEQAKNELANIIVKQPLTEDLVKNFRTYLDVKDINEVMKASYDDKGRLKRLSKEDS